MKLIELLKMPTEELMGKLRGMKETISGKDCVILKTKSTKPKVCLVCHTDTFFDIEKDKRIFHDKEKGVLWSPDGLGADDRAGIYACLKLYEEIPEPYKPMVLFCDEEESAGIGAMCASFNSPFKDILSDVLYFIELDRRGFGSCVFYNHEPYDFVKSIEGWGYKKARGTFTDISIIGKELGICSVNLSIGYYQEHSRSEYLVISEMENSIARVKKMLIRGKHKKWELPKISSVLSKLDIPDSFFDGVLNTIDKGERYYGKFID